MIIYGTHRCPDCEEAERILKAKGIAYEYVNIFASTMNLKAFLSLRDNRPEFDKVKEDGRIGVPCFYFPEEERIEFDIAPEYLCNNSVKVENKIGL